MTGGVGVLSSTVGVVGGRAGLVITIGSLTGKTLFKWVEDTDAATLDEAVSDLDPIDPATEVERYFDIFVDGQWGWSMVGRNVQVLFITVTHPRKGRGYTMYAAVMDLKSTEDYVAALRPFADLLLAALEKVGADGDNVRFHSDEEDGLIAALKELFVGCSSVGCGFHKSQCLDRHIKVAFGKKRYVCKPHSVCVLFSHCLSVVKRSRELFLLC